jgi:site-specific DNA-methyltransferase (adenine-specific)
MSATTSNPAIAKVMFSSASDDWATPQAFYDALDAEFGFVLDACSSTTNHKAPHFFALDHPDLDRRDGLAGDWAADARTHQGAVWLNPVYGRTIGDWMAKAADTARAGATVVCLVPARTDTRWFHDHVLAEGAEVRYVRGRLKFGSATTGAPFASLVIIYRGHPVVEEVEAAAERSAEVVAAWPEGDVQDVLELGDGDRVRPGPPSEQVLDGGARQVRRAAGGRQAATRQRLPKVEGHAARVADCDRLPAPDPGVEQEAEHVVRRTARAHEKSGLRPAGRRRGQQHATALAPWPDMKGACAFQHSADEARRCRRLWMPTSSSTASAASARPVAQSP